jgi:adenylosuccinate synthase
VLERAEDFKELSQFIIDISVGSFSGKILAEGAQGYWLDVDQGDYPYVTSSNCGIGAVINNGFSHKEINKVVGVAKAYSTYVGAKQYQKTDDPLFEEIRKVGLEYGATTGRSRQIDWLDLNELSVACMRNGVDHLIINKLDVLEQLNCWKIYDPNYSINKILNFESKDLFKDYIRNEISSVCSGIEIEFQESPH